VQGRAGLIEKKSHIFLGGALRCLADSEAPPQKKSHISLSKNLPVNHLITMT
jgi:hypothetical protein